MSTARYLYRAPGSTGPNYYVDGNYIYEQGTGTLSFYFDGTTIYAMDGKPVYWIDGNYVYSYERAGKPELYLR